MRASCGEGETTRRPDKARAVSAIGALLGIGAAMIGCGPVPDDAMGSGLVAGEPQAAALPDPVMAYQGTVTMVGGCGVGVARVESDFADLYTYVGDVAQSSIRWVREGQVVVACGVPHRMLGFVFQPEPANAANPGSGRAIVLDANPATTVKVAPGAVVLTLDGVINEFGAARASLKDLTIVLQGPRPVARFRAASRDGQEQVVTGGAGDSIEIAGVRHSIIDVSPADAAAGIPGWVQIDESPDRPTID
jgi:F0F1-type ATP synthase membrane subunit c/vacuolar-type H+-ATPase subunit K